MRILDIGCGDGSFARKKFPNAEIIGIDLHSGEVEGDMRHLPFKGYTFDIVLSNHSIEHLQDPRDMIDEVKRVLVPYGKFIINTPNLAAWHNRISLLFGLQPRYIDDPRHGKCYTYQGLKRLLKGFKVISHHTYGNKRQGILNILESIFSILDMGSNLSVLLQKEN